MHYIAGLQSWQNLVDGRHQRFEVVYVVCRSDQNDECEVKLLEVLLMLHVLIVSQQYIKIKLCNPQ